MAEDSLNTLRMAQADSAFDHYEPIDGLFARIRNEGAAAVADPPPGDPPADPPADPPDPLARLITIFEEQAKREEARDVASQKRIDDALEKLKGGEPSTDKTVVNKEALGGAWRDEFDQRGYSRADFEMARLVMGGVGPRLGLSPIEPSETFMQAYHANVTEDEARPQAWIADADGKPMRAMDTAETGFGLQLIGTQFVRDLWEAARNDDSIVASIRDIPMTDPTVQVPIDGALPEMLFVGESTSNAASAYGTSKTASNRATLTAKKFTIQQIWSGELEEDSIIAFTPFLRERLNMSAALHLGSSYLNGDTTNAGTGNINLDDANPADTKHYLAWNGIRFYWITTTAAQGKNMAAALDLKEINVARGKLNGTDDDIDTAVGNINWGSRAADLRLVCDWDTYMALLDADKVVTIDKYGPAATIVTGELGRIWGIPIIAPSYAVKTEADGKQSDTESSNTKGQITLFNPQGWLGGVRRDTQLFFDRIQRTDQFLFELYTRRAFTKFGENVAAGIYNITL
jgi:HK97 family phage major capsid protein